MFVGRRKMGHTSDFIYLCDNFCFEFFLDLNVIRDKDNDETTSSSSSSSYNSNDDNNGNGGEGHVDNCDSNWTGM